MDYIKCTKDSGIHILTLNREQKHNAFNSEMIQELIDAIESIDTHSTRVLIINANGKHFCAGADLTWMQSMAKYSFEKNLDDAMTLARLFQVLYQLPIPTIACVQGGAFGGGAGLVSCADIVLATPNSRLCFSEAKLGIAAATISPYVVNKIGANKAKRYFMTAEMIDANTALSLGLFDEIHESNLFDSAMSIAQTLCKNGPNAVKASKALAMRYQINPDEHIKETAEIIAKLRVSDEGQEGLKAFFAKAQPNWIKT